MAAESSIATSRTLVLSEKKLREMIREARGGFAPDHVASILRGQLPHIVEEEANDIAELLRELVASARSRLIDAGLEPEYDENAKAQKLSKREREYVSNIASLLTLLAVAEMLSKRIEEACLAGEEGLAWCRLAGDHRQESGLLMVLANINLKMQRFDIEEEFARRSVEAARASGNAEQMVVSLNALCAFLNARHRLDEAEVVIEEALAIMRRDLDEEGRSLYYAGLLMNKARISMYRTHYLEGIRILREALRWADADLIPMDRAMVLAHLGSTYLRLGHFRQSIECQHEVIKLGAAVGSALAQSWGYYRLAEAHLRLEEWDLTGEMLDRAMEMALQKDITLRLMIEGKRAQLLAAQGHLEEGVERCMKIIEEIADHPLPDLEMFVYKTLADIQARLDRLDESVASYRHAVAIAEKHFPPRAPMLKVYLARVLHRLGSTDEVVALLDEAAQSDALNNEERAAATRLRGEVAEARGDFRSALNCEREAFAIERLVLESQAEVSLRNARIIAETDLLEREADLERERRRRLERELAEAIVQLGDRKRQVETVERKLRKAIEHAGSDQNRSVVQALRETLMELRSQSTSGESPLRYLSGVDEDFYRRLRGRCPDLTPKQERLCGLLRAGLASKEISTLLKLGPEGLKAQRKRLRKKLGLEAEEKLETVLAEL